MNHVSQETPLGQLLILDEIQIFDQIAQRIEVAVASGPTRCIGLSGGSTPKRFYQWASETRPFGDQTLRNAIWMTSDERAVPVESDESNFGVADRLMLTPLAIERNNKRPWPTFLDPHSAASAFNMRWNERFGPGRCFDLCLLGMGNDGHTASIFPGSPLLGIEFPDNFVCVEVPEKGWRYSISKSGLGRCREILITVTGESKAEVLKDVFFRGDDVYPVQLLKAFARNTTWLVDKSAASML